MSDPTDIAMTALGAGGGAVILGRMAQWWLARGQSAVDRAEETAASKLDQVLVAVVRLESDVRLLVSKHDAQAAEVGEVKARIEGISANYGGRLGKLEERVVVLETNASANARRKR